MTYTQLTQEQRYQIYALLKTEQSQTKIATVIGVHKSTISREIGRNCGKRGYRPKQAHRLSVQRRRNKVPKRITTETWSRIDEKLQQDWSPEQVSGWLKKNTETEVSHEWIYQHIYMDKRSGGNLYKHLRCQKKRRKRTGNYDRRGKIPNQVSIEDRPEFVEQRERIGDWEGDTIVGAGKQGVIVTLVERKSRFTLLKQVVNRTAAVVENAILDMLEPYQAATHTITFDNGKEFANHLSIAQNLQAVVYFAHPYASWERGTNENTNGLIRQYFPKGSDFSTITDDQISFVNERLNYRPRKCLDFQAPVMVFSQLSSGCT
jgi:transposase, IS30 family